MSDQPQKRQNRLQLLIYPWFQLTLLIVNAMIMIASFGFIAIQTARSFENLRQMGAEANLPATHAYFKFLDFQSATLFTYLAIALVGGFLLSTIVTLVLSHRLAGPLIRMLGFFRALADGHKPNALQFRKGDFFIDLPPVINAALDRLQKENRDRKAS